LIKTMRYRQLGLARGVADLCCVVAAGFEFELKS